MLTLVYGLGVAGEAVATALRQRGEDVMMSDDSLRDEHRALANRLGATVFDSADLSALRSALEQCSRVVPAPGIPEQHALFALARIAEVDVVSEIELAYEWEQARVPTPRPMVAITGTDGKTTTTMMAAAILRQAGLRAEAVGNTEVPLIAALSGDAEAFVVESSSFRLATTKRFRCAASAWLNIAPDHLDWHVDFDSYWSAKAKIWSNLRAGDVAVAPIDDARILRCAADSAGRVVTFGLLRGDYHAQEGVLTSPHGPILLAQEMTRAMPHDITNALAAAAVCIEAGLATPHHAAQALREFRHAPHRIEFVADSDGVRWFDDSKATSPHAALVAIRSFDSVVLIAGGRNKDLDLAEMAAEPARMRGVVAIGESASEVSTAFDGVCSVRSASTMTEAVAHAAALARPGDAVLLSPGCTSFDWYRNYAERGDDFRRCVLDLITNSSTKEGQ